jgi:hypothetical protein
MWQVNPCHYRIIKEQLFMSNTLTQFPTVGGAQFRPEEIPFGFIWGVQFHLPEAAKTDGHIIQYIYQNQKGTNSSGKAMNQDLHYWEAWKVMKGSTTPVESMSVAAAIGKQNLPVNSVNDYKFHRPMNDIFFKQFTSGNKGNYFIYGIAAFYEGTLPGDFIKNNSQTGALQLFSTTKKPPFWQPGGLQRAVNYEFDFTNGKNDTKFKAKTIGAELAGTINSVYNWGQQMYQMF